MIDVSKTYDFTNMTIQEIADVAAQLKLVSSLTEKHLDKAKAVVKSRYADEEITKLTLGITGEIEIREADDFHDINAVDAFDAMELAGFAKEFPLVCTVQMNNSGKKAKVQKKGITHYLPAAEVEKLRIKKRKKAVTVYFREKKVESE